MTLILDKTFEEKIPKGQDAFDFLMQMEGETFRSTKDRVTLRFDLGGETFFIKKHFGVGWKEIIKNLVFLRLPIIGAKNEYQAILKFESTGIPTYHAVAFGLKGENIAKQQSFIVTEELADTISLEDVCKSWGKQSPTFRFKKALITKVAETIKKMHENGMNHRDLYICHFLICQTDMESKKEFPLYLIDLHRVQIRGEMPERWKIKDLAALLFSVEEVELTKKDVFRFLKTYFSKNLREILRDNKNLLEKIVLRAKKISTREKRKHIEAPAYVS